jgi:hypothetical protein
VQSQDWWLEHWARPHTPFTAAMILCLSSQSGTGDRSRFVPSSEPCSGLNFCDGKSHVSVFARAIVGILVDRSRPHFLSLRFVITG